MSGLFFPQRLVLRIDGRGYSPTVLDRIVSAGVEHRSFATAARMLQKLSRLSISAMHVRRITQQVGDELHLRQDEQTQRHRQRDLPSEALQAVEIACVEADGGRINTRDGEAGRGVHSAQWKEDKVAVLWRMTGLEFSTDPHPHLPRCFADRDHVTRLVRQIHGTGCNDDEPDSAAAVPEVPDEAAPDTPSPPPTWPPQRIFRTCIASLDDVHDFGPRVAAEAQRRGFYQAPRQVFVGDGGGSNWTIHKLHFPHFTPVLDFVHAVAYLHEAAGIVTNSGAAQWEQYVEWATACWQGGVEEILQDLEGWQEKFGKPPDTGEEVPENDSRAVLHRVRTYLQNNRERMKYPSYRQTGLPITSALVESCIKQFNWRVKSSDKFWTRTEGAEAILQVRAAWLSDGEPLEKFITSRPGNAFYHRSPKTEVEK